MTEHLSTQELAALCAAETARYQRGEPHVDRYGLELFRRAVAQRDERAWEYIYAQYAPLVRHWAGGTPEDPDDRVLAAFERFWRAVDASKFARFTSLGAVLQYLKLCLQSASIDRARAAQAVAQETTLDTAGDIAAPHDVAEIVASSLDAASFWHEIQMSLANDQERLVLYLSYVIGLAPREIQARHPTRFPNVRDIYRLKREALDRLRRRPTIRAKP